MSSATKRIQKKIGKSHLMWDVDMYSNLFGSIPITSYILSGNRDAYDIKGIVKKYKSVVKTNILPVQPDDPDFIKNTLQFFGIGDTPDYDHMAFVLWKGQQVIAPWDGKKAYPLREDGVVGNILRRGTIHPLKNDTIKNQIENDTKKKDGGGQ